MTLDPSSVPQNEAALSFLPSSSASPLSSSVTEPALRSAAIVADAAAALEGDAAELWQRLVRGLERVVDEFFTEESCYLVLSTEPGGGVQGRRLQILQLVLAGIPQNSVAIDLQMAASTVATHCRDGLEMLGASNRPSRAHPLLMLGALAATEVSVTSLRSSEIAVGTRRLRVVAARRPDLHLRGTLPVAEEAVVRRLVEGCTYAELSAERRTSPRTIANQIAAVFRRLRVSGRSDLVRRLLFDEGLIRLVRDAVSQQRRGPLTSEGPRTTPGCNRVARSGLAAEPGRTTRPGCCTK